MSCHTSLRLRVAKAWEVGDEPSHVSAAWTWRSGDVLGAGGCGCGRRARARVANIVVASRKQNAICTNQMSKCVRMRRTGRRGDRENDI